jgi:hypothetical protein
MRSRAMHRAVVVIWLCCQAVMVAVSPLPSCRDHGPAWGAHVDGSHAAHGCPMHRAQAPVAHAEHHQPPQEEGPSLRCRCAASDSALAALILGTGLVPAAFVFPFDPGTPPAVTLDYATLSPHLPLDTPPPRL